MNIKVSPSYIDGRITAPPSKSSGHRLLICAALAQGDSVIEHLEYSEDIKATIGCITAMGAKVRKEGAGVLRVTGCGGQIALPDAPVFCGESGSTLRFCLPLFSLTDHAVTLTGAGRLMERPQDVYRSLFEAQGLQFVHGGEEGITISGRLTPGEYTLPGNVSSQFISGLLFTLPLLGGNSTIHIEPPVESRNYIDLTLSALNTFGVEAGWEDDCTLVVPGRQQYHARKVVVEGDWSNAAFMAVLGALRGDVRLEGLDPASAQGDKVIAKFLRRCGCRMKKENGAYCFGYSNLIAPVTPVDLADCPDLGPILMVLAAFCTGRTTILNAGRLRIKESDRIATMQHEMAKMGVHIQCVGDTIEIEGGGMQPPSRPLKGHNDHRIVMALTVALLGAGFQGEIQGAQAVNKSWPGFFSAIRSVGGKVEVLDD